MCTAIFQFIVFSFHLILVSMMTVIIIIIMVVKIRIASKHKRWRFGYYFLIPYRPNRANYHNILKN